MQNYDPEKKYKQKRTKNERCKKFFLKNQKRTMLTFKKQAKNKQRKNSKN